jgi:hypothetical protein
MFRYLDEACKMLARKMATAIFQVLLEQNLLQDACDEWINPVIQILSDPRQTTYGCNVDLSMLNRSVATTVESVDGSKVALNHPNEQVFGEKVISKVWELSKDFNMCPDDFVDYALDLAAKAKGANNLDKR